MKESRMSKSASGLPSISATRPFSTRADGVGSHGLWNVANPASGSSAANWSWRNGRVSHSSKRRQRGAEVMLPLPRAPSRNVSVSEPSQPEELDEDQHDHIPENDFADGEPLLLSV